MKLYLQSQRYPIQDIGGQGSQPRAGPSPFAKLVWQFALFSFIFMEMTT